MNHYPDNVREFIFTHEGGEPVPWTTVCDALSKRGLPWIPWFRDDSPVTSLKDFNTFLERSSGWVLVFVVDKPKGGGLDVFVDAYYGDRYGNPMTEAERIAKQYPGR